MKNREKYITNRDATDLILTIHDNTTEDCAIEVLTGQPTASLPCVRHDWKSLPCVECLRQWLDTEVQNEN